MREWVDGAPLGRLPDADEARAVGRLLGAMHERARRWAPPPGFARRAYDAVLFRRAAADLLANVAGPHALGRVDAAPRAVVGDALAAGCAVLDRLWGAGGDVGVVHADLHDGNLLWAADGGASGAGRPAAVDFGRCGLAPLALDVAMAQHYLTPALADHLLDGYLET